MKVYGIEIQVAYAGCDVERTLYINIEEARKKADEIAKKDQWEEYKRDGDEWEGRSKTISVVEFEVKD